MKRTALFLLASLGAAPWLAPEAQAKDKAAKVADNGDDRAKSDRTSLDDVDVSDDKQEINLSVGENYTLSADGVKSYSEGQEGIVQVRLTPDGKQFVIVGKRAGSTSLLLLMNNGEQRMMEIDVVRFKMSKAVKELTQLLEDAPGLRVRRVGGRLFIEGGVNSEAELKRIQRIAALYPDQVESLVVIGGPAADRKRNIRLDLYFIQLDRGKGYQVGVSWPGAVRPVMNLRYDLKSMAYTQATAEVVDQALPGLDMAATKGWAKVLKHSTLITANGSEATFSSGGEANFKVAGSQNGDIKSILFGTKVTVLPRFDSRSRELEVKISADIADLTPPTAPGADLPGRNTTQLSTLVGLKLGQGLVLSGIRSASERHSVGGIPLLSEIPVLGVLFGSHSNQEEQVEGAVYMVPSIVEAAPVESKRLLEQLLETYEDFDGNMPEGTLPSPNKTVPEKK
jgi:pilus assembly protein CpaC